MKIFQKKLLSASVSTVLTLTVCSAIPMSQASDISIYSDSQKGKTGILLMLDTSGSMGISSLVLPKNNSYGSPGDVEVEEINGKQVVKTLCEQKELYELDGDSTTNTKKFKEWVYNAVDTREGSETKGKTTFKKTVAVNGKKISYYLRGCGAATINDEGKLIESSTGKFDRLSRLKDAVIQLLASQSLDDKVKIGLGHFSARTDIPIGNTKNQLVDGHSGRILVPVAELTAAQREILIRQLAGIQSVDTETLEDGTKPTEAGQYDGKKVNISTLRYTSKNYPTSIFKSSSGTPTAHAYAEAGAYMMGTTTGKLVKPSRTEIVYDGNAVIRNMNTGEQLYYVCVSLSGEETALGVTSKTCDNQWNKGMSPTNPKFYENNGPGSTVGIYKPDPDNPGEWLTVLPGNYKNAKEVKDHAKKYYNQNTVTINNVWTLHQSLPIGWRWGGWMKVEHEPMDIEPIGVKVWTHHDNYLSNMVSYRSSPFSLTKNNTDNMVGGFTYADDSIKTSDKQNYKVGGSPNQCDGNGIYFLTDGAPNSTKDSMAQAIMNLTLVDNAYQFASIPTTNVLKSPILSATVFNGEKGGWEYIGAYAKKLRDKTQNPGKMSIKTAVVGFGSSFAGIPKNANGTYNCEAIKNINQDAYNACKWGGEEYGDGGFYYAENSEDIKNSIVDFVRKVEVDIKPVATGTPIIPVDALNPTTLQNEAYYASFQPTVSSVSQIWMGNLNKYRIKNGELFSADGLQRLISTNGALNDAAQGFWAGGVLGQLKVGADFLADGKTTTHRKIFTNRTITDSTASASKDLQVVDVDALFDGAFAGDSDKLYWLNALGYKLNEVPTNFTKANLSTYATDKRLGAVMHSTPVLLTQEGQISVLTNNLVTTNRKDYLMYGSTQGVLHVVDVSTGQEVFGFLPHEMMVNQKQALLLNDKTTGGMSNLFYGIDAPWVAHTQYTTKNNGLLTVKESDRTETDEEDSEAFLKGHQWVYGGLRMGGKSYYALNLTDINNPKMMFHIDPSTSASEPLQRMGESWSKPTLAYVNWGGEKKLVMFVGGGYDAEGTVSCTEDASATNKGYECPTYQQTNKIGAGVYMFDAQNGELLWWTSADNNDTPTDSQIRFTANSDLQYSVVSQINAIDRNADGLVDHLYFADLAGQAFRVDLNNNPVIGQPTETDSDKAKEEIKEAKKNVFGARTVTLFTEHKLNGLSPRFYEMPSVSVHTDTDTGGLFAAVAFSSGNRSAPLADSTQSANDGVFVVYDNDVIAKDLYAANYVLNTTKANTLKSLIIGGAVPRKTGNMFNAGWKHSFSSTAGSYKGMNDIYALDGMLYVNVFHKDGIGISGSCGGGVKGDSYLYQYCLPYGKCDFYTTGTTSPNRVKLGAGILGTGIGQGYGNKISTLGLIVNRDNPTPVDCALPVNKNLPQCQLFDNAVKLKQLRWYEAQ